MARSTTPPSSGPAIGTAAKVGVAALRLVVAATGIWALADYRAWRALGVGGLPPTWRGWATMTRLRLKMTDPLATGGFGDRDGSDRLADLPVRAGDRPRIAPHPIPHRQLGDHAPSAAKAALAAAFDAAVAASPEALAFRPSHFERHNPAITALDCCPGDHGEIAHIHPSDGSMHMILSPTDAATVIARAWGERHGLAGIGFGLPPTYLMIYAPRTVDEVAAIATILDAAIGHAAQARNPDEIVNFDIAAQQSPA